MFYSAAHEILSILKKPKTQEGFVSVKREPVEVCRASQSSDFAHFGTKNGVQGQFEVGSRSLSSVMEESKEQTIIIDGNEDGISCINPSDNGGDPHPQIITPSSFPLGYVYSYYAWTAPSL